MPELVVMTDMRDLRRKIERLQSDTDQQMGTALKAGGLVIQNQWKRNIVDMGAVLTGTYLRSVSMEQTGPNEVTIGSDIIDPPYPEYVEFGTSRMEARPAARNAIDSTEAAVIEEVANAMRELFNHV